MNVGASGHVGGLGGAAATMFEARSGAQGSRALSAAKRIAIAALHAQATRGVPREVALTEAARAYADGPHGASRGGLKKAVSEARAILEFGVGPHVLDEAARLAPDAALACVDAAVQGVRLRDVTRARAAALAGGRGGRPTARPTIAYAAVRKLLHLAQAGDPAARAELTAIQDLMRAAPSLARTADRPAASRRS